MRLKFKNIFNGKLTEEELQNKIGEEIVFANGNYKSFEEALHFTEKASGTYYAVKYKDNLELNDISYDLKELYSKLKTLKSVKKRVEEQNHVCDRTEKFTTCKFCGSTVRTLFVPSITDNCPVCGVSLLSNYTRERLDSIKKRINIIEKKIEKLEKDSNTFCYKWLVCMYE